MRSLIISFMILLVFTLFGCNNSDISTDITVLDGYIKGATVTDNKGQIAVEKNALIGLYTFATTPAYPIRTTGGIIVDTNETFDIDMIAYSGHVISPISTFIGNDENLTNNLKQSLGFLSKDDLLDDYMVSNNLPLARVSALLYAVLKDSSLKQAFQNRLKTNASDDLFADAIEDSGNSPVEFLNYIDDLISFNSNVKDLETFLENDKNNLSYGSGSIVGLTPPAYQVNNILFAHGLNADKSDWDVWVNYLKEKGWNAYYWNKDHNASIMESESNASNKNVYRCSVTRDASIEIRATQLAQYINTLNVPDDSITAVGHSMGGLDLHYIISKGHDEPDSIYYSAAQKIHKVYTLASPHKGNQFAGTIPLSPAIKDLGLEQMQQFNKDYPYRTFEIDNRKIELMALRFECFEGLGADGIVSVQNQSLNGAPHSQQIYIGKHAEKASDCPFVMREQNQSDAILNDIIIKNKNISSEIHDIVFYEGNDCSKDEKGVFSSSHETEKKCTRLPGHSHNENCDNDEIRSVKIFPGVTKNTMISVYDDGNYGEDDDWAVINTGKKDLTKSICINSFESSLSDEAKNFGITKFHHEGPTVAYDGNKLDGKISSMKIKHSFESKGKVIFYEGKNCKQNIKASYDTSNRDVNVNCKDSDSCDNDEIKSVLIFPSVANDTIIKLYDDPDGKLSDDWLYINRGSNTLDVPFCINDLEHNTNTEENEKGIHVDYHHHNGLNGKVSHVKITKKDDEIVFLEGDNCTQNVELTLDSTKTYEGSANNLGFQNDEIRSVLIFPSVANNTIIELYDRRDGNLKDDCLYINRGSNRLDVPFCINDLEHNINEKGVRAYYHHQNGLNGKVSRVKVSDKKEHYLVFFEGNDCKQDVVLSLDSTRDYNGNSGDMNFQNDEIRSMLIQPGVKAGKVIKLYDDPDGDTSGGFLGKDYYGWAKITVKRDLDKPVCVNNFDGKDSEYVKVHRGNSSEKLEGKVSRIIVEN